MPFRQPQAGWSDLAASGDIQNGGRWRLRVVGARAVAEMRSQEALYRDHATELVRFATVLVGPSDAPDAVSDAIVSLLRDDRLAEAENPRALMFRAVMAKARSMQRTQLRRRERERRVAERLIAYEPDLRPDVVEAVVGLSTQQRACVYLAYWEDLKPDDIAERLGIGTGTVKRYLSRARERLREVIDE